MTGRQLTTNSPADRTPARVLVVDDELTIRQELAALLAEEGVAVVGEAQDGATAVALAARLGPDVVLMDLRMPQMNGIEATRRVKQALPHTQVIMLTAYEDAGLQRNASDVGAYAYLVKGCSAEQILETLDAARRFKRRLETQRVER